MSSENSFKSLHYVKTGIFAFPPLEQGGPEFGRAPRKCLPWRFERPDAVWGTSKEQYFKVLGSQSIWASIDKQRASRLRKKAKQPRVSETNSLKSLQVGRRNWWHNTAYTQPARLSTASALSVTFGGFPMERDSLAIFQVHWNSPGI